MGQSGAGLSEASSVTVSPCVSDQALLLHLGCKAARRAPHVCVPEGSAELSPLPPRGHRPEPRAAQSTASPSWLVSRRRTAPPPRPRKAVEVSGARPPGSAGSCSRDPGAGAGPRVKPCGVQGPTLRFPMNSCPSSPAGPRGEQVPGVRTVGRRT